MGNRKGIILADEVTIKVGSDVLWIEGVEITRKREDKNIRVFYPIETSFSKAVCKSGTTHKFYLNDSLNAVII